MVVVLFDLEGTLVKTTLENPDATHRFRRQTRRKLTELGIPAEALKEIVTSTLMRNKAREYVKNNFTPKKAKQFHRKLDRFLTPHEMDSAQTSKLYPHAVSVLQKLRKQGYRMGLITNTSTEAANYMLKRHGLTKYFNVVITRNNVEKLKPEPEGTQLTVKKLKAESFILVGDLSYDAEAAEKAGGKSIIVNRTSSKSLGFQADYVVRSLPEVPSIIQKVASKEQKALPNRK